MSQDIWKSNKNFEKKYKVHLEKSNLHVDGYRYMKVTEVTKETDNKHFVLVFHFKKAEKSINPLLMIDSIEGDDFPEKIEIITHFKKNSALKFATSVDGLDELIKEEKHD